jgi:hypothetical protein
MRLNKDNWVCKVKGFTCLSLDEHNTSPSFTYPKMPDIDENLCRVFSFPHRFLYSHTGFGTGFHPSQVSTTGEKKAEIQLRPLGIEFTSYSKSHKNSCSAIPCNKDFTPERGDIHLPLKEVDSVLSGLRLFVYNVEAN